MEDRPRPTNPSESDRSEEEAVIKKRRRFGGDFLSGWLQRRAESGPAPEAADDSEEDDEEDEDTPKNSSRTQAILKNLFPRIVSTEEARERKDAGSSLWEVFIGKTEADKEPEEPLELSDEVLYT